MPKQGVPDHTWMIGAASCLCVSRTLILEIELFFGDSHAKGSEKRSIESKLNSAADGEHQGGVGLTSSPTATYAIKHTLSVLSVQRGDNFT